MLLTTELNLEEAEISRCGDVDPKETDAEFEGLRACRAYGKRWRERVGCSMRHIARSMRGWSG